MTGEVFNSWVQRERPLSLYLAGMASTMLRPVEGCRTLDELDRVEGSLQQAMANERAKVPYLGGTRPPQPQDGTGSRRQLRQGTWVPTTRHHAAVQVIGSSEVLRYWPDANSALEPVDVATADVSSEWTRPSELWTLQVVDLDASPQEWSLYTYVDLTEADELLVARGEVDLLKIFTDRRARLESIADAIGVQAIAFFETTLPTLVQEAVGRRRAVLTARNAVTASLTFPQEWLPAPTTLVASQSDVATKSASAVSEIAHAPPLSPATFESVQCIIRSWADAVERTPAAFTDLVEERLSDLLAATLNATVPYAGREVYSRGGRSDIYVQADTLSKGRGPARIFICELKFARSRKVVREALDPQLFGYLSNDDTAAVLILFFRQTRRVNAACNTYLDELRDVPGYMGESEGAVSDWPIMRFVHDGRKLEVCVAQIKVPKS